MPTETFFNLPEDKRQRILDLAIDEFAENDYASASISRVVARAGIAKGSFYQYFADKQDLYLYLLQLAVDEKKAFFAGATMPDPEASIFEMMRWLFRYGLDFEFSNPKLSQIGYRAVYGDAPLPEETAALLRGGMASFYGPLVARGMAAGDIDPALDPDLVAFMLNAMTSQLGDYLLKRLEVAPETLATDGVRGFDQPGYLALVDELMMVLERGLKPAAEPVASGPRTVEN